jgi:hypothetical protein
MAPRDLREPDAASPLRVPLVGELTNALAQSEQTTRQLLNHGLIPGARRMNPLAGRSPWLIPPDAPSKSLEQFYENAS